MTIPCWLRGQRHADLLQIQAHRLFLQCQDCGRETPGWPLEDVAAPTKWSTTSPRSVRPALVIFNGKAGA